MKNINFMKKAVVLLIVFLLAGTVLAAQEKGAVERYALYVASNKGGNGRETLRYAGTDAQRLADTMIEVGGIKRQNSFILVDSTKDEIDGAFDNITSIIERNKASAKRTEFLFYYSGHSDEESLLLGDESYDYSSLKAAISAVPSDVHVVMLDSCFSGNFIRAKGGSREKSFLIDDSSVVQGHAYLSSSSESEASQESDTIGSSYFTQSLVTGLRGAADTSGDNKVSLNELYYYAFNNTLSQTETTAIGPQHPSYNITLVGSGDLVLTDLSVADSVLTLPAEASGEFLVRTFDGTLVSDINKTAGTQLALALPVGYYAVTQITESATTQTTVKLEKGTITTLDAASLRQIPLTLGVARGPAETQGYVAQPVTYGGRTYGYEGEYNEITDPYLSVTPATFTSSYFGEQSAARPEEGIYTAQYEPFVLSFVPGLAVPNFRRNVNFSLSAFLTDEDRILGGQLAAFMGMTQTSMVGIQTAGFMTIAHGYTRGIQTAGFMNIAGGEMHGIQSAGFMNIADKINGIQTAGFLNIADSINGVQIGVINVADECHGISLGLINVIGNGIHAPGIYFDFQGDEHQLFAQYQSGTRHFYTTWLIGTRNDFSSNYCVVGGGIGTRFGKNALTLDLELLCKQIITDELVADFSVDMFDYWYPSLRVSLNLGDTNDFSLFGAFNTDLFIDGWNDNASLWKTSAIHDMTINGTDCMVRTSWSFGFKF